MPQVYSAADVDFNSQYAAHLSQSSSHNTKANPERVFRAAMFEKMKAQTIRLEEERKAKLARNHDLGLKYSSGPLFVSLLSLQLEKTRIDKLSIKIRH
jgi:uncharacterized protein YaiL (DUF2058 family)